MGGKFILDSNVIIDFFRGNNNLLQLLETSKSVYFPAIVLGELIFGAQNSLNTAKHLSQVDDFISKISILNIDASTAVFYGKIKFQLKKDGKPIPENDIWIAAIAVQYKTELVTNDKHFKNIKSLKIKEI
jgi:tRNA(fMet)-specific endonuclease VapC